MSNGWKEWKYKDVSILYDAYKDYPQMKNLINNKIIPFKVPQEDIGVTVKVIEQKEEEK